MSERLTEADLARMRAEHNGDDGSCAVCWRAEPYRGDEVDGWVASGYLVHFPVTFPCDAARLLAHFAPGPVPHLAGVAYGLLGPSVAEELAR